MFVTYEMIGNATDPDGNPDPSAPPLGEYILNMTGLAAGTAVQVIVSRVSGPQQNVANLSADQSGNVSAQEEIPQPQLRTAFEAFGQLSGAVLFEPGQVGRDEVLGLTAGDIQVQILARIPPQG